MTTVLLIIHSLLAVTLLGAITHQAVSVAWPRRDRSASFVASFRGVNGMTYTNAIVVLFLATAVLGSIIYPAYRLNVRTVLQRLHLFGPEGAFEMKEHFVAIGAALLPAYWYFWRSHQTEGAKTTRMAITVLLAVIVWTAFLVGHVLNNIRGFGS
jgi:hypothetical protein